MCPAGSYMCRPPFREPVAHHVVGGVVAGGLVGVPLGCRAERVPDELARTLTRRAAGSELVHAVPEFVPHQVQGGQHPSIAGLPEDRGGRGGPGPVGVVLRFADPHGEPVPVPVDPAALDGTMCPDRNAASACSAASSRFPMRANVSARSRRAVAVRRGRKPPSRPDSSRAAEAV